MYDQLFVPPKFPNITGVARGSLVIIVVINYVFELG